MKTKEEIFNDLIDYINHLLGSEPNLNNEEFSIIEALVKKYSEQQNQELLIRVKELESKVFDYSIQHDHYLEQIEQLQSDKQELIDALQTMHKLSLYQINKMDDRIGYLPHGLFDLVDNLLTKHQQNANNI